MATGFFPPPQQGLRDSTSPEQGMDTLLRAPMDSKISLIYQRVLGRAVSPSTLLHEGQGTIVPTELKIVKLPPSRKPQALGWSSRNAHHTKFWGADCIYGKTLVCLTWGWTAARLSLAPPFSVESEKDKPHPQKHTVAYTRHPL